MAEPSSLGHGPRSGGPPRRTPKKASMSASDGTAGSGSARPADQATANPPGKRPAVTITNLVKRYGSVLAVDDVSFSIQRRRDLRNHRPQRRRKDDDSRVHLRPSSSGFGLHQCLRILPAAGQRPDQGVCRRPAAGERPAAALESGRGSRPLCVLLSEPAGSGGGT